MNINYLEGAKLAMQNAAALQDTAQNSAKNGNYGIASSLGILSAEEAIKAFFCLRKHYINLSDPVDEFDDIFKNHKVKHKHIVEMLKWMRIAMDNSKYFLDTMKDNFDAFLEHHNVTVTGDERKGLQLLVLQMNAIANKPLNDSEKQVSEWWAIANQAKNQRLYVGLSDAGWQDPSLTDENFWNKVMDYSEMTLLYTGAFMGLNSIFRLLGIISNE